MEIGDVFELRESIEFFPGERLRIFHQPADFEAPIFQRDFWFDAEIENRKTLGKMLARWKTVSRTKSGRDKRPFLGGLRPCFRLGAYSAERGASAPGGPFCAPSVPCAQSSSGSASP